MTSYRGANAVRAKKLDQLLIELHELDKAYTDQKIVFFNPIKATEKFYEGQEANVRLVLGANRSSKTVTGCAEAFSHMVGYRPWYPVGHPLRRVLLPGGQPIPVPNVGRIIAQNYEQAIRQTIMVKVQEWWPKALIKRVERNTRGIPTAIELHNGSIVYLMSNDQDDMSFEGPAGHWFWADEPIDRNKYTGLRRGLVDHNGHCWLTMTPLSQPWINDDIVSRAGVPNSGVLMYRFSIWDNCKDNGGYLERSAIEAFLSDQREDELEARLHANFLHLAGRVYKTWEPREPFWVEPFEIPVTWPRIMLCDPHGHKPLALLWVAISPSNRLFCYRASFDRNLKTISDASAYIKQQEGWPDGQKRGERAEVIAIRIIDWSAEAEERTSGTSIRKKFGEHGLIFHKARKQNAEYGYDSIHTALKMPNEFSEPGIVVFNTCLPVKQNFENFCHDTWTNARQEQLKGPKEGYRKTNDDFIDLIRYVYQSGLTYRSLTAMSQREMDQLQETDFRPNGRMFNRPGLITGYSAK